jgi:flagellar protein FlbD
MIKLTRIQGEEIYINEDNIQWIECNPDTTITFINGNRFIVKEKIEEILAIMKNDCQIEKDQ